LFLTKEQELMLKGEYGLAVQKAMELLVALGDALNAEKLIPISSAHISGISYANIGDAGLSFIEDFSSLGAQVKVLTTLNPAGIDLVKWREMGVSEEFYIKQTRVIEAFKRMGVKPTCTCTPYLSGNLPKQGSDVAWAESSAVVYVNSVVGAKTNRESGPSALASAITGLTPYCGFHLESARTPTCKVLVSTEISSLLEASALGYLIGRAMGIGVPAICKLKHRNPDFLKALSAGLATSGGISMFHLCDEHTETCKEKIQVDRSDIANIIDEFSPSLRPDYVFFGCPHCSLNEIKQLSLLLEGRRIKRDVQLWIFTSRAVFERAKEQGYTAAIESAGSRIFCDACPIVMPKKILRNAVVATNSCKAAHYLTSLQKVQVCLMDMKSCIQSFTEAC